MGVISRRASQMIITTDDNKTFAGVKSAPNRWLFPELYKYGAADPDGPTDPPDPGGGTGNYKNPGTLSHGGYNFNSKNLGYAIGICEACDSTPGANNDDAKICALICAIIESAGLWMYANYSVWPESRNYPHDRNGADTSSVGLFQQRPDYGWGTVKQCMTVDYSTKSFLGGSYPGSPRGGSWPIGLLDIDWRNYATPGSAVQKVQVSAFPDRYDQVVPTARAILNAIKA